MSALSTSGRLLTFDDVTFNRKDRVILSRIRLTVSKGELVVITGRSGSGKTSLLKLASGLVTPDRGRVFSDIQQLDNQSSTPLPQIAFVRQKPENQLIAGTVEEEVAFALSLANMPLEGIELRVDQALERTGLTEVRTQQPHTLSGGMMQRLAIAAALATDPQLWLFDEPTSYLDPPSRLEVQQLAREAAETGCVLYVASSAEEWRMGDRLVVLHNGRILADGPPEEVIAGSSVEETGMNHPTRSFVWQSLFKNGNGHNAFAGHYGHLPESLRNPQRGVPSAKSGDVPLIRVRGLVASRNALLSEKREVLHGIDLEVGAGECIALIGPTGAGKSTLLEVLADLTPIDSGVIESSVVDRSDQNEHSGISMSFQFPERQFFAETVIEEVAYGVRNTGVSNADANRLALEALSQVGLDLDYTGRNPFELSGGEARRVALAIVLALRPRLLLLDEPTAGLDSVDADRIGKLLAEEIKAGRSVIVSGHDLDRFAEWCPRWVLLKDGQIVYDGSPADLSKELRESFWL
jgi:energy-coupling factor transport system ATP-binding protein